jgi:hypothetical protein
MEKFIGIHFLLQRPQRFCGLHRFRCKNSARYSRTYYIFSDFTGIPGSQFFLVALPIFIMACFGVIRKQMLPLAISSNLSFCYAMFLLLSWNQIEKSASMQASLSVIAIPTGASLYTLLILLVSSLLSFFVSHLVYVFAIGGHAYRTRRVVA